MRAPTNAGARILRSARQHRVKTGTVNMPARTVWVEDEIIIVQMRLSPGGADGEGTRMIFREELIQHPETREKRSSSGRQHFADANVSIMRLLDDHG